MASILIVKPILPYPVDQGTKVVTFNLLKVLSKHFEVSLVCGLLNREDVSNTEGLQPYCKNIFTFLLPNRRSSIHSIYYKALHRYKASFTGFPLEAYYCSPRELSKIVARVTRSARYDIAQFEYWFTADAARLADADCKVLLEHDVDFLRYERRLQAAHGFWERRHIQKTISAVRAREVRAYSEFDRVLALSPSDSVLIEKFARIKGISKYLPVMVDCDKYRPLGEAKIPGSVVFLGALDADFNVDALDFFRRGVFPLVVSEMPEARLFIVGRKPPALVRQLADGHRIVLCANVDEIAPYVGRCMVQVVPLRFGGGVRIRTLEGMALGMAIVTTTVGVDGVAARPGRDLLLADTPDELAARVCEVLRNPLLAARLGERAREFVLEHHSEAAVEHRIVRVYGELKALASLKRVHIKERGRTEA